jgi:hypothetical protein
MGSSWHGCVSRLGTLNKCSLNQWVGKVIQALLTHCPASGLGRERPLPLRIGQKLAAPEQPEWGAGPDCICLAASEAPLPQLAPPSFGI